jgi:hypothetical protein
VGEASLFGKARAGRLVTATDESHQERVEEMVRENRLKQQDVALEVGV